MKVFTSVWLAALLGLASCGTAPYLPIPDYTRAWQHETDGALLRFTQPGTGAIDTLRVEVAEFDEDYRDVLSRHKGSERQLVTNYLRYSSRTRDGLTLRFSSNIIRFDLLPKPYYRELATLYTHPKGTADELVGSDFCPSAAVLDTVVLAGRAHGRAFHSGPLVSAAAGRIQEFWYAKRIGLVAYTTADGKTWYRL